MKTHKAHKTAKRQDRVSKLDALLKACPKWDEDTREQLLENYALVDAPDWTDEDFNEWANDLMEEFNN